MESSDAKILKFLKEDIRLFDAKSFDLAFVHNHGMSPTTLLEYSFHKDTQVAFRAAWLLEHCTLKEPECIVEVYSRFMQLLRQQKNWSCIRSFSKLGMVVNNPAQHIVEHSSEHDETWIEQCFGWVIAPDCPVAVLVNGLDILYYLSIRHSWIREELVAQIQHLLKTPTPALASRAKRILKRIL